MQKQGLVESLVGMFGIWLIVRGIPDYVSSLYLVATSPGEFMRPEAVLISQGVHFVASLACGLILLLMRHHLSRWLTPGAGAVDVTALSLVAVGAAVIGLYLAGSGLASVTSYLFQFHAFGRTSELLLWSGASSVAIGGLLFAASPRLAKLWSALSRPNHNVA
jgi:hypothetical protein